MSFIYILYIHIYNNKNKKDELQFTQLVVYVSFLGNFIKNLIYSKLLKIKKSGFDIKKRVNQYPR